MLVDGVGGRARLLAGEMVQIVEQSGVGESFAGHLFGGMKLSSPAEEIGQREGIAA